MPRVSQFHAVATAASIASLYGMAEAQGEVQILVKDRHACLLIRNKCYAHRTKARKQNSSINGIAASHLDAFEFSYGEYPDDAQGRWFFRISYEQIVEFEILIPDGVEDSELPEFDTLCEHSDVPIRNGPTDSDGIPLSEIDFHRRANEQFDPDPEIPF